MTNTEALRALGEMVENTGAETKERDHYFGVIDKILDKEMEDEKSGMD
jgi:hypothetical protein